MTPRVGKRKGGKEQEKRREGTLAELVRRLLMLEP